MKKILILLMVMGLPLSACLPAFLQPLAAGPTALSSGNLEATAGVLIQQTLESLPSATSIPSSTPVVRTATSTPTAVTETATAGAEALTLTATTSSTPGVPQAQTIGALPFTLSPSATPNAGLAGVLTDTPHPQHFGTIPPYLPFGKITLINKSKSDVYISLQCTTNQGFTTILEYPVSGTTDVKAPFGKYTYVAWVGGKKVVGKFTMDDKSDLNIKIFKDHLEISRKK